LIFIEHILVGVKFIQTDIAMLVCYVDIYIKVNDMCLLSCIYVTCLCHSSLCKYKII